MSQKLDCQGNYMDDVRVKISEKFKPPPKINLTLTYAQRISLNKQLQDSMPRYDFSLELSVKEKMKELLAARKLIQTERNNKLDLIKEERKKAKELYQKEQDLKCEEAKDALIENNSESNSTSNTQTYVTGGLLIPTQVNINNYSNILTPIPLTSQTNLCKPCDKSPINISDFEPDTCSPFDNVELKSINDLEELKLVLQNDKLRENIPPSTYIGSSTSTPLQSFTSQSQQTNSYGYNVPHSSGQMYPSNSMYRYTNEYSYYVPDMLHPNVNSYSVYNYNAAKNEHSSSFDAQTPNMNSESNKAPFRSVPDIISALQTELNSTHLDDKHSLPSHSVEIKRTEDDSENPFDYLPINLQDICKVISAMGFPLPRVARACKEIGDDQKKVVEHLLAMSELLDLGFSEKHVSSALIECNNDRDKALEMLIS